MNPIRSRSGRRALALLMATTFPLTGATLSTAHAASPTDAQEIDGPNLLVNGGFERGIDPGPSYVLPSGDTSSLLQGWTVLNAGLDKFWPAVTYIGANFPCKEGKYCLELVNGGENPKNIGGVKQTFATVVGQKYHLRFYQSADVHESGPRALKFTVAGQSGSYSYVPLPNEAQNPKGIRWIQRDVIFTALSATTTLEFDSLLAQNGYGSLLDNVQVRAILPPAGTPTPAAGQTPAATTSTTAQLAAAGLAGGSRQTVNGSTHPNGAVTLIVDYPDGSQFTASIKAGADGRYTYSWKTLKGARGPVQVLVDGAGSVARTTFTASS